jgi:hypothetical protein
MGIRVGMENSMAVMLTTALIPINALTGSRVEKYW